MKAKKLNRLLAFLLSFVMVFGMVYVGSPFAYAQDPQEPTWPYLEADAIKDTTTISWTQGVVDDFSSQITSYEIKNEEAKKIHSNADGTVNVYDIGDITFYVDKLPSGAEIVQYTDPDDAPKIKLAIKVDEDKINWDGVSGIPAENRYTNLSPYNIRILYDSEVGYVFTRNVEEDFGPSIYVVDESSGTRVQNIYIYDKVTVLAGDPSGPQEPYKLLHEKQSFSGFGYGSAFYTERFINASGESITSAVPGETVTVELGAFEADPNYYISYSEGAFTKMGIIKRVLTGWEISADTMDTTPGADVYSFTFTMPEHDVTVKALTEESGVPVKKSENIPGTGAELHLYAYKSEEYGGFAQYTPIDSISKVIPGTEVVAWVYLDAEGYLLDTINVLNHDEPVDESRIDRDIDFAQVNWAGNARTIVEEGGDYTFEFVFHPRSFAKVTVVSSDASIGSAEGSVENGTLDFVWEGDTVTLTATPKPGYVLDHWDVKVNGNDDITITVTPDSENVNKATFVIPRAAGTDPDLGTITATAVFEAEGQEEGEARIQQVTASFDGMIRLNYYVSIPEGYADDANSVKAVFTLNGKTTTIKASDAVYVAAKEGYKFSISVLAAEVSDTVNIKFVDKNDAPFTLMNKSGTTDFTETGANFSVLQYMNMIAGNGGLEAELDNAAKDYCNAVKNRFLGTSIELRSVVAAVTENDLKDYAATMTGTLPSGISFKEMTVMFESDNSFRFYFNFNGVDPHSTDYTYTIDGKPAEIKQSAKGYYLVVPSIAAAELDNEHTIVVSDGTATCTMKASALSYARAMIRSNASEADTLMCKALYLYNQAANAFFD